MTENNINGHEQDAKMELSKIKVAVIGAGAAGLCALRHLNKSNGDSSAAKISAVAFEMASKVGGTWVFTEKVGKDENGLPIHSSMYRNLRTNLPKECMAFPDFAFPQEGPSYVKHEVVQKYLEDYTAHFGLYKYIRFERCVKLVSPIPDNNTKFGVRWEVTSCGVKRHDQVKEIFDAVLICNGHYAIPNVPKISGEETFPGEIIHSHNYRAPEPYYNKRVLLLGCNSSGQDISLELAKFAKEVYLCHNKPPLLCALPDNLQQRVGIDRIDGSVVTLLDGSQVSPDVLMYCTGYHFDFKFLSPECKVKVDEENHITPLYKHIISTKYPNLGMIGIINRIIPFPMFDVQVRFFRAILQGIVDLPSEKEMNADAEAEFEHRLSKGLPQRHAHTMGAQQFIYNREMVDMFNGDRIPESVEKVYLHSHRVRLENLMGYKNQNFSVKSDGTVEITD